ncbi:hypothetical protein GALMADRAFT_145477 [Galerina marginata CBS 339.88]|uniref:DUF6533 domain-containing protein n=1 Tax=Galerina marginata (strain CBS 339.88) TaxID=685588 RepID=A0A067SEX1_GALM3|nr:hypothetical protein GALMADRAFT_145477 [Galerina marginata CBS 339.88]
MSASISAPLVSIADLNGIQIVLCTRLASAAVIIYDHFVTFDREVAAIWPRRWSLAKILFLTNRYFALTVAIFIIYSTHSYSTSERSSDIHQGHLLTYLPETMYVWKIFGFILLHIPIDRNEFNLGLLLIQYEGWVGLFSFMLTQGILQLRLYALYSMDKKILGFTLAFHLVCLITSAWIMEVAAAAIATIQTSVGLFCISHNYPTYFYSFWIPLLLSEILLCTLAVVRGIRESSNANGSILQRGRRLVDILIRDSVIYFIGVGVVYLICMVVWINETGIYLQAPITFPIVISSTLGSRLILNIREADTISYRSRFSSFCIEETLRFKSGGNNVSNLTSACEEGLVVTEWNTSGAQ